MESNSNRLNAPTARSNGLTTERVAPTQTYSSDTVNATEVALVLGAGGPSAEAWHSGVTQALHEETGWDARSAELIVGTSAGAITGLGLRAGIPPSDLYALKQGETCSSEGQEIIDRIVTEHSEGRRDRSELAWGYEWTPQSPVLTARSMWPPWKCRPVHAAVGLLPNGIRTTEALEQWLSELHPDPWPQQRFWVPTVRLDDGRRVVFGRDDVQVTPARAIRASCAVPAVHEPVLVGGSRYVDGGLHSATNADLAVPPDFDAVVVSSAMSGTTDWSKVRNGLRMALSEVKNGFEEVKKEVKNSLEEVKNGCEEGTSKNPFEGQAWWSDAWSHVWNNGLAVRIARRQRMTAVLRNEVDELRRMGTAVLVVEPDAATVALLDSCIEQTELSTTESRSGDRESDEGPEAPHDLGGQERDSASVDNDLVATSERLTKIATLADAATRKQLHTRHGARFAELLRQAAERQADARQTAAVVC